MRIRFHIKMWFIYRIEQLDLQRQNSWIIFLLLCLHFLVVITIVKLLRLKLFFLDSQYNGKAFISSQLDNFFCYCLRLVTGTQSYKFCNIAQIYLGNKLQESTYGIEEEWQQFINVKIFESHSAMQCRDEYL